MTICKLSELVHPFLTLFGQGCIEAIPADREFIGDEWFRELTHRKIPFYIRIWNNLRIEIPGRCPEKDFWVYIVFNFCHVLRKKTEAKIIGELKTKE